jgi:hypothetical protein
VHTLKEMRLNMMRSRSRVVALITLFITCAVLLSGCFHIDSDLKLNGDGSGSYTLTLGLSEAFVGLAGDEFVKDMDKSGLEAKQAGGDYRHFDKDGYSVWVFTRPFKSVSELNDLLRKNPASSTTNPGDSASAPSTQQDALSVTQTSGFFVNSFHVTGHISLKDLNNSSSDGSGIDTSSYLKDARESVSITMPGWVNSYAKGGEAHGNTVTYTAHYNEEATIDVVGGGINPTAIYIAVGVGLLALLVIGGVVFWRRRARAQHDIEPALAPVDAASAASLSSPADLPGMSVPPLPSAPSTQDQAPTS